MEESYFWFMHYTMIIFIDYQQWNKIINCQQYFETNTITIDQEDEAL